MHRHRGGSPTLPDSRDGFGVERRQCGCAPALNSGCSTEDEEPCPDRGPQGGAPRGAHASRHRYGCWS